MKPIDFILYDGDSEPNRPVYQVSEAMQKDIRILGGMGEYTILSYYLDDGQMVLEIEEKT